MTESLHRLLRPRTFNVTLAYNDRPNEPMVLEGPTINLAIKDHLKTLSEADQPIGVLWQGNWVK